MNLYEQQSTYNPNMPLRMMQYIGNLYEKYIKQHELNKYGSELIKLPVPKLVVFYNGTTEQEDEKILRLSDSFPEESETDIEVIVRMININYGHNAELLDACRPLREYSWLIHQIRSNLKIEDKNIEKAVDKAIKEMPEDFIIKPFLDAHRAEVREML